MQVGQGFLKKVFLFCVRPVFLPFCFYLRAYLSSWQGKRTDLLHPFLCQSSCPEEEGSSDDPVLCSVGGSLCLLSCHPGMEGVGRKDPWVWRFGKDADAHLRPPLWAGLPVVLTAVLVGTAITGATPGEANPVEPVRQTHTRDPGSPASPPDCTITPP